MPIPTYLLCRNNIWYFNYRIPESLRYRIGASKRFIRKSLRTKDVKEAVKLSRDYIFLIMSGKDRISRIEDLEAEMERSDDMLSLGYKVLEEYLETETYGNHIEKDAFWKYRSRYEFECYQKAVEAIEAERQKKESDEEERVKKLAEIQAEEVARATQIAPPIAPPKKKEKSILLSELIEGYVKFKVENGWSPKTRGLQEGRLRIIKGFLEFAIGKKNPMIHLFTSDHAILFEEEFCKYPKNCKKLFPDMSVADVMSQIDGSKFRGIERISRNNYNEYAQLLMAVFNWAKTDKKRKYLEGDNVFVDLKKESEPSKSYDPFTVEEIGKFFGSEMYTKKKVETRYAWRYWIPIIMLYHGMRLEEVAQLQVKNIIKSGGVWCFDIRNEFDFEGNIITITKKRGKKTGERVVPIHGKVLGIGFLDYVKYQKDKGNSKVFPTLRNRNQKGEYKKAGSSVTAWFNEDSKKEYKTSYFTRVNIDKENRNVVLYSFKHSAETLLINHPDNIEHDKIDIMIGHLIKSTGRKHYGKYDEKTILEVVEKIDYPEANLPWDVNRNYNDIKFQWE